MNEIYPFMDPSSVLQDTDFGSNGMMRRTAEGVYDTVVDNSANWDAAYTHISNNGSDHSFIDQSVVSGSTPTFVGTNITGVPAASILAGTFGAGAYVFTAGLIVNSAAGGPANDPYKLTLVGHMYGGGNDYTGGHIEWFKDSSNVAGYTYATNEGGPGNLFVWSRTPQSSRNDEGVAFVDFDTGNASFAGISAANITWTGGSSAATNTHISSATGHSDVTLNTIHRGDHSQAHSDYLVNNDGDTLQKDQNSLTQLRVRNINNGLGAYVAVKAEAIGGGYLGILKHATVRTVNRWGVQIGGYGELLGVGTGVLIGTFSPNTPLIMGTELIRQIKIDGSTQETRIGLDDTNYLSINNIGNLSFVGTAGFYPRYVEQQLNPQME